MPRRRCRVWCLALVAVCWAVGPRGVEAASSDADGTYTVTITKVEVSKDSGATYVTVFSGSQAINIASVNAGAVAASLVSGVVLDAGTYNRVRVTLGANLQVKGFRNTGSGTTDYTNGTTFNTVAGNDPGGDYAVSTFTINPADRLQVLTISPSVVIQPGGSPNVTVTFNTSGVIAASYTITAPSVSVASS